MRILDPSKGGIGIKLNAPNIIFILAIIKSVIEPMVSAGDPYLVQLPNDSYATRDKSLSAHFEHTVLITEKGPEILTR